MRLYRGRYLLMGPAHKALPTEPERAELCL